MAAGRGSARARNTDKVFGRHPELGGWLREDTSPQRAGHLAALVAAYHAHHGYGPSWAEFGQQARPELARYSPAERRAYADRLIRTLARGGWLAYDDQPGSLAPGPAGQRT